MLKFKVNDVVEITANDCYHEFEIGQHVIISRIVNGEYYDGYAIDDRTHAWAFDDDNCKAIEGVLQ